MKIIIEQLEKTGISMHFDVLPFPTREAAEKWSQIVREVLQFAYLNRSGWLISVQPQSTSLIKNLTAGEHPIEESVDGKPYIFQYQTAFTVQLLDEIATEDDFARALLWLVSSGENEKAEIYKIIRAMDESLRFKSSMPIVETEWLLAGFDYAETLYWFNPAFPHEEISQKLKQIAASYGYELAQN